LEREKKKRWVPKRVKKKGGSQRTVEKKIGKRRDTEERRIGTTGWVVEASPTPSTAANIATRSARKTGGNSASVYERAANGEEKQKEVEDKEAAKLLHEGKKVVGKNAQKRKPEPISICRACAREAKIGKGEKRKRPTSEKGGRLPRSMPSKSGLSSSQELRQKKERKDFKPTNRSKG